MTFRDQETKGLDLRGSPIRACELGLNLFGNRENGAKILTRVRSAMLTPGYSHR